MKKAFVFCVTAIMMGLVIAGSGVTMAFQPDKIIEGRQANFIAYSAAGNTSFLAPSPVNYTVNPISAPSYYHALIASEVIGVDDYYYLQ
jgi:hypothetical protein